MFKRQASYIKNSEYSDILYGHVVIKQNITCKYSWTAQYFSTLYFAFRPTGSHIGDKVLIKSGNCGKTLLESPVAIKPLSVKGIITSFRSSNTIYIRLIDSPWFFILTKLVVQGKLRIFSISFGRQGINLMGSREIFGFLSFVSSLINPVTCERPRFESDGC